MQPWWGFQKHKNIFLAPNFSTSVYIVCISPPPSSCSECFEGIYLLMVCWYVYICSGINRIGHTSVAPTTIGRFPCYLRWRFKAWSWCRPLVEWITKGLLWVWSRPPSSSHISRCSSTFCTCSMKTWSWMSYSGAGRELWLVCCNNWPSNVLFFLFIFGLFDRNNN